MGWTIGNGEVISTTLYWACGYLSVLVLKLFHFSKTGLSRLRIYVISFFDLAISLPNYHLIQGRNRKFHACNAPYYIYIYIYIYRHIYNLIYDIAYIMSFIWKIYMYSKIRLNRFLYNKKCIYIFHETWKKPSQIPITMLSTCHHTGCIAICDSIRTVCLE